ncbi:MAG TPA: protein kinase [Thermoanaerobaculia bacterium]|nr:protein kinase [Thermoanaerobaculia bacterium]
MTLSAGTRLGPYEILSAIGAGGMGEVYKARDTRLDREVAVKVLPEHLAASEEIRQRFEREAKTISQFSHPHICALYDVGREGDVEYLVMEFLEGESLADRLGKGALPTEQILRYGIEIADALDKAHRQGIVHRDLKPGNIMITKSGVKLLDFGLAKPLATAGARPVSGASVMATEAQVSQPLTERGTILGTFQYMAPEQLEGGEADSRSDIFAFGAVLYEMATGRKAFTGKSQASLIGSILRDDPAPVSEVAPMVPPAFNRVIKTCLAKDPEHRFQTAHDIKLQLEWIQEGGSQAGLPAPVVARRKNREKLAWAVAAVAVVAAAAATFGWARRAPKPPRLIRFEIATPPEVVALDTPRISPDGRVVAFNAADTTGKAEIWLRPLDALQGHPLPGTEGAGRPFWSPDSKFIGFFADGKLKKVDIAGGPPQKICDAPSGSDGSWNPEGVILYDGRAADPIMRVPAAGGTPVPEVLKDPKVSAQIGWPEFLPDGKHYFYMSLAPKSEDSTYRIGVLGSKESKPFASAQTLITYAPQGYLLFVRDRTLVAQRFDASSLKTLGEPVPLAEKIGIDSVGLARFSVSREGTLVYRTGEAGARLQWVDRNGKELEVVGDQGEVRTPAISLQGDRLAFTVDDPRSGTSDIWVRDLARGTNSRLTFGPPDHVAPAWSPDGKWIAYRVSTNGPSSLAVKAADGTGEEKILLKGETVTVPTDWSRDGRYVAYTQANKEGNLDLWALPVSGEGKPILVLQTPFNESNGMFSPDGRFMLYQSNESGRIEIYVRSFPGPGGKWQISTAGGADPHWSADGKEITYRTLDQKVTSVEVKTNGDAFEAGVPRTLFLGRFQPGTVRNRYAPAPDGQKFLVVSPLGRDAMAPTTVVLNWWMALEKK